MTFLSIGFDQTSLHTRKKSYAGWENSEPTISSFFTTPATIKPGFVSLYARAPAANPNATVQCSITYGHITGAGSWGGLLTTKAVYGAYRTQIYGTENAVFSFGQDNNGVAYTSPHFLAITLARSVYRQYISTGSITLTLKNGANTLTLTDLVSDTPVYVGDHKVNTLVAGTGGVLAGGASVVNTVKGVYGYVFPEMGLILLNPEALALSVGSKGIGYSIVSTGASSASNNPLSLLALMQGNPFSVRGEERITSRTLYLRVAHNECNYTTNPTAVDDSGVLLIPEMVENPETFISQIGIYNDQNELLAVIKPATPIIKRFDEEVYIIVRL